MCPTDPIRNGIVCDVNRFSCVQVADVEVDSLLVTFWNYDTADTEEEDIGCVAHFAVIFVGRDW